MKRCAIEVTGHYVCFPVTHATTRLVAHPLMDVCLQVRYVFKNLCRDWSKDGEAEREACYGPLIEARARQEAHTHGAFLLVGVGTAALWQVTQLRTGVMPCPLNDPGHPLRADRS